MWKFEKGVRAAGLAGLTGIVVVTSIQGCGSESGSSFGDGNTNAADDASASVPSQGFGTSDNDVNDGGAQPDAAPVVVVDAGPPVCGDGKLEGAEKCDDGNTADNDGCTALCTLEANFVCNVPGTKCAELGTCGDGQLKADERCDDGNTKTGDGCSAACEVEDGWACPLIGAACKAVRCGDGKLAGDEECDDGNTTSGNGCSSTCTLESGYKCPTPGVACSTTTCGDGKPEGTEQCDDGNLAPYDSCSPTCTAEPTCPKQGGACAGTCGDGIIFPGEDCDDGNARDGDGCSSKCKVETSLGYSCSAVAGNLPGTINQPIIYRDFSRGDKPSPAPASCTTQSGCASGHADMNPATTGDDRGLLGAVFTGKLDVDGEPTAVKNGATTTTALLADWYRSTPATAANPFDATHKNYTYYRTLPLTGQKTDNVLNGTYVYTSTDFFPIDTLGFGNQYSSSDCGGNHNFHFTSEMRFWFLYDSAKPAPRFDFTGDDDVFVFINGLLAVDIGGIHNAESDHVILDATTAGKLKMTSGQVYEFALFQAERNRCESNYTATFSGFVNAKSVCKSTCGDGIKSKNEVCDDGQNNSKTSPPAYGKCALDCLSRGPYCGDATKQAPQEACDDGAYNGGYGKCKTDCSGPGPKCGDGVVDAIYGEVCDDAGNNDTNAVGATAYGKCASDCRSRPRCGDGIIQTPEQCDDGNVLAGDSCSPTCTPTTGGGPK